jgi:hypothetical protein
LIPRHQPQYFSHRNLSFSYLLSSSFSLTLTNLLNEFSREVRFQTTFRDLPEYKNYKHGPVRIVYLNLILLLSTVLPSRHRPPQSMIVGVPQSIGVPNLD